MPPKKDRSASRQPPDIPRPSASVLLISQTNQILLLHRVRTSSSFPSAHVFPGGNLSSFHDGAIPDPSSPERHEDGPAYRLAAIRETFEESGILLAVKEGGSGLMGLGDEEREKGRRAVHGEEVRFGDWLEKRGGRADIDGLIPFTRWVTPPNIGRRFTTQMYIYFLPLPTSASTTTSTSTSTSDPKATTSAITPETTETLIPTPTTDGGIEHTAARFAHPSTWLSLAQQNEIILFPPQYYLLHLLSPFFPAPAPASNSPSTSTSTTTPSNPSDLSSQRARLLSFLHTTPSSSTTTTTTTDPPWSQKCISPTQILRRRSDGRAVLGLDAPGRELEGSGRRGDSERVVLVDFRKEGPRGVEVRGRREVLEEERVEEGMGKL